MGGGRGGIDSARMRMGRIRASPRNSGCARWMVILE